VFRRKRCQLHGIWCSLRRDEMAKEWVAVLRAADAAARWHVHQRRKGAAQEPYVNHLLEVATLVAEATDGKDLELVVAALRIRKCRAL
jgi:(p)ppGpp synthase/HD superfamily hydrolase